MKSYHSPSPIGTFRRHSGSLFRLNPAARSPRLILSLLLLATGLSCQAQSWQTVEDFQLEPDYFSSGSAITVGASDIVFAAGLSRDNNSGDSPYAIVRRSGDHGVTWETVDSSTEWNTLKAVAASSNGAVAIVGSARDGALFSYWWRVRVSRDGGANWSTVYDPRASANYHYSEAVAASFSPDGTLYVAGWDFQNWVVRRSTDLGASWSEVAKVPRTDRLASMRLTPTGMVLSSGELVSGLWQVIRSTNQFGNWTVLDDWATDFGDTTRGLTEDKSGNLVVVGGVIAGDPRPLNWVVRRSTNGGATWTVTDQLRFPLANGIQYGHGAMGVVTDIAGRIWVTGSDQAGIRTRVSYDGGASWTNSDSFRYPGAGSTASAWSSGITADSAGNIYTIGVGNADLPAQPHWVVRKLAAGLPPPLLSTWFSGATLSAGWPSSATGFVLQSATSLSNGGDWQASSLTPIVTNGQNVVTMNPTSPAAFFRLRHP